jgi:hypothetical protein
MQGTLREALNKNGDYGEWKDRILGRDEAQQHER